MSAVVAGGLSQEQRAATAVLDGPVRVVAGAGTGKTAVIAARFRLLLEAGVDPGSVLVMTFTERAAGQMRERILADSGIAEAPHVGTFHSLAMRWLRDEGRRVGVHPAFRILAGPDRWIQMRELLWELGDPALVGAERPDDLVGPLLKLLERTKQELVPLPRLHAWLDHVEDGERRAVLRAAVGLFHAYAGRCRRDGLLDFDDLLVRTVRLLQDHDEVRDRFRARFPYVLVDEYQDTNLAQERIVELVAGPGGNVCVVGDDDQSIYRFRGASRASMDRFLACFPSAATLTLGRNRRSTRRIVTAARRLIERNPERLDKPLAADPEREEGTPVEVWRAATAEQEAMAIAAEAARVHAAGMPLHDMAVLARTHAIARPVAAALAAAGVPYQHWAGQGLFRRPEIRDLIAYLRLLHDPSDLLALARLLVRPPLGLDLAEALQRIRADDAAHAPLRALREWTPTAEWAALLTELAALKATLGVDELLFELMNRTRYLDVLLPRLPDGLEGRRVAANVSRFAELVSEYCERRRDHSLSLFVEHVDLVLRSGLDEDVAAVDDVEDAVQLMTIHQAKGLEFDLVFLPALVEGRLPQPRRQDGVSTIGGLELPPALLDPGVRGREDQLAEERRLCYVAMTRARGRLVLSRAERYEGGRAWRPSRFLDELGDHVVERDLRSELVESSPPPARDRATSPARGEGSLVLSFSGISAYRECPRQHWYRFRLRLPAMPTVEAQFGTIVHLALMRAGRIRREGRSLTEELLHDLHQEAWETVGLVEPRRRPALEALGWRLLRGLLDAGGLEPIPALVEQPFAVELDGWTLRGVIDRVDEPTAAGGARRIVDYKTGSPIPASRLRRDLQLALYALGARDALGMEPVELEIVYLRDGGRVVVPAGEGLLDEARRIGGEVAAAVRDGRFEARPERRRCAMCAYRLACEAAL
ncbi:MAG TPA: ATP-dependent DNA helicase [Terriglobales bacterium]|nr:ATP-dependent DNA helicase [Terriglobales bacterium]